MKIDDKSNIIETRTVKMIDRMNIPFGYTGRAISCLSGRIAYYKNGIEHRLGGPAISGGNFLNEDVYCIEGKPYSKTEYWNDPKVVEETIRLILELDE